MPPLLAADALPKGGKVDAAVDDGKGAAFSQL
jgi:hypothetical protein